MDNAYKSLDLYSDIVVNRKKFKIKKMNIGEYIEFTVNFQVIDRLEKLRKINKKYFDVKIWKESLVECVKLSAIKKPFLANNTDLRMIVNEAIKFNAAPSKGNKEGIDLVINNDYLQIVIHELALYYHWSKDQILKLYPEEMQIYFAKIGDYLEMKNKKEALFLLDLEAIVTGPHLTEKGSRKYYNDLQRRREAIISGDQIEKLDIDKFKKQQADWLATQGVH
jgi:hypothetical protein